MGRRVELLGQQVEAVTLAEAAQQVLELAGGAGGLVVTMNVDHVVRLPEQPLFRAAYEAAALRYVDGMPLVWLARRLGRPVPGRVTGADLVPAVLARGEARGLRVHLVGGRPEVAARARAEVLRARPGLVWTGHEAPPPGFERDPVADADLVARVAAARPEVVLVCLGSPKQEEWALRHRAALPGAALLCVGAAVDFLAGTTTRAPDWVQRAGLEWAHRLASDPVRLWRRYLVQDRRFARIAWQELRRAPRS